MSEFIEEKSPKTLSRIEKIKQHLREHRQNIILLHKYKNKYFYRNKASYAPRLINITCIPKTKDYYQWTLKNLNEQVMLLENELKVLLEYGL